jgi:hypothetical protein
MWSNSAVSLLEPIWEYYEPYKSASWPTCFMTFVDRSWTQHRYGLIATQNGSSVLTLYRRNPTDMIHGSLIQPAIDSRQRHPARGSHEACKGSSGPVTGRYLTEG